MNITNIYRKTKQAIALVLLAMLILSSACKKDDNGKEETLLMLGIGGALYLLNQQGDSGLTIRIPAGVPL